MTLLPLFPGQKTRPYTAASLAIQSAPSFLLSTTKKRVLPRWMPLATYRESYSAEIETTAAQRSPSNLRPKDSAFPAERMRTFVSVVGLLGGVGGEQRHKKTAGAAL